MADDPLTRALATIRWDESDLVQISSDAHMYARLGPRRSAKDEAPEKLARFARQHLDWWAGRTDEDKEALPAVYCPSHKDFVSALEVARCDEEADQVCATLRHGVLTGDPSFCAAVDSQRHASQLHPVYPRGDATDPDGPRQARDLVRLDEDRVAEGVEMFYAVDLADQGLSRWIQEVAPSPQSSTGRLTFCPVGRTDRDRRLRALSALYGDFGYRACQERPLVRSSPRG